MTTRLQGALKRELEVGGATYTLTISPEGLRLVPKGKRNGVEMTWDALARTDPYTRARESTLATRDSR